MQAQSYVGQGHAVQSRKSTRRSGGEGSGAETIFGLILALTAMYGIGSVLAFVAGYVIR